MTIKAAVQAIRKKKPDVVKPLGAIVESSDDAMIGRDLDGIATIWNTGAERLYGYGKLAWRPVGPMNKCCRN